MGEVGRKEETVLGFKHLVLVKFKKDVKVEEILEGLEKLVLEIDLVKSFEWGKDKESPEMLTKGLTHSFIMTFENKEDYTDFVKHPSHAHFSSIFSTAIDDIVLLDFAFAIVKPPPTPIPTTMTAVSNTATVVPPTVTTVPGTATTVTAIATVVPATANANADFVAATTNTVPTTVAAVAEQAVPAVTVVKDVKNN